MSWHSTEKVKIPQRLRNPEKRNFGTLEQFALKLFGTSGPNGQAAVDGLKFKSGG